VAKAVSERIVTIFGTARAESGDAVYELATEIGRLLAESGFTIANGGYGGTMLAAAKGAAQAGGKVIGITCTAFGRGKANSYISREVGTETLDERLETLIKLGAGYVVLPGGTGTLLELAMVWELKNKGFMDERKPIILVGDYWKSLVDLVATDDGDSAACVCHAADATEVRDIMVERV
jgi:uncharacterized protein (TIGR00730 family)